MNKADYNKSVVDGIHNKIGILQIEHEKLKSDNSTNGLLKRVEIMTKIATLYEALNHG